MDKNEFLRLKKIKTGEHQNTYLVLHAGENGDKIYAIKVVHRELFHEEELDSYQLFEGLYHSLLMAHYRTFNDRNNLYFVCEFVPGLNLLEMINEIDDMTTDQAKMIVS